MKPSKRHIQISSFVLLVAIIAFSETHRQYDSQLRFYGAIGVVTLGSALLGWNARQMFVHLVVRRYVGGLVAGAGLIAIAIGTAGTAITWLFAAGVIAVFTGVVLEGHARNDPSSRNRDKLQFH